VQPGLPADKCSVLQVLSCGIVRLLELHSLESEGDKGRLPASGTDLGRDDSAWLARLGLLRRRTVQ